MMDVMKKQRIKMGIGLLLTSGSVFIGDVVSSSIVVDFCRGFCTGLGIVLIVSAFYKLKRKTVR
jgi:hypothetical protein